jgi:hypothetical protein
MINRREFVTIGATTLAASSVLGSAFAATPFAARPFASSASAAWTAPFRVIFDRTVEDGRLFAQRAARIGAAVVGIENDVAELWYDELRPRLQQGLVPLAGLTTPATLFCLQQLASNHWMKVRFRAEHHVASAELLEHRLQGSEELVQRARDLLPPYADWRTQMADLVTRCPVGTTTMAQCTLRTRADSERSEHSLVSWIITA